MAGRFGKGLIPSPAHRVGLGHPGNLLGAKELPREANVPLPPPTDQGSTNSCTGNSSAVAICAAMSKAKGLPPGQWVELPSRLFLYFCARSLGGNQSSDDGAMISDVFDGASKLGVPPESAWPFATDTAHVTAQPTWDAFRLGADQKVIGGAWRILSVGAQRVYDVRAALANGDAVVLGTSLDQRFEDLQPGHVWPGVRTTPIGGHAIVCCGYRTNGGGLVEFKLQNSWGQDWCEGGCCWIADGAVASRDCSDLWIVHVAPSYAEAA